MRENNRASTGGLDRSAAWDLYLALDLLAASHTLDPLPHTPDGPSSDLAYAQARLTEHRAELEATDPALLDHLTTLLNEWTGHRADRLLTLLPLRDDLSRRCGGVLPDTLPPAP